LKKEGYSRSSGPQERDKGVTRDEDASTVRRELGAKGRKRRWRGYRRPPAVSPNLGGKKRRGPNRHHQGVRVAGGRGAAVGP